MCILPSPIRKFLGAGALAFLFSFPFSFQAKAIVLNFANLAGTDLDFSGGGFTFTSTTTSGAWTFPSDFSGGGFTFTSTGSGYQFDITSVSGGVGDSVGLNGYVSPGGPFTIGTIFTVGAEQIASVSGIGIFNITDQNSINLTGAVQWQTITTFGPAGILDLSGLVNLTGLNYTGANSDLQAMAAVGSGVDVITFQFVPAENLTQLATTGGETSYSGTIEVIPAPEPGTLTLAGFLALAGLLARWFRCRKSQSIAVNG